VRDPCRISDSNFDGLRTGLSSQNPAEGEPPTIIGSGARGLDRSTIAQIGPNWLPSHRATLKVGDLDDEGILHGTADNPLLALAGYDRNQCGIALPRQDKVLSAARGEEDEKSRKPSATIHADRSCYATIRHYW
jgi:hypothetical protein